MLRTMRRSIEQLVLPPSSGAFAYQRHALCLLFGRSSTGSNLKGHETMLGIGKALKGVASTAMKIANSPLGKLAMNAFLPGSGAALSAISSAGIGSNLAQGGLLDGLAGQIGA